MFVPFCWPCDCDLIPVECGFRHANVVFRGTVDYDDDNGTGSFVQRTIVRFKVSEVFKGLDHTVDHVWVDPGSFTSCYAEYRWGKEYLVFAYRGPELPETSAMTLASPGRNTKRIPPELLAPHPPPIYYAPECAGTVDADYPGIADDVAAVRRYAAGAPLPPVTGQIALSPYKPWDRRNKISGVVISLDFSGRIMQTTTDANGRFSFHDPLPEGTYRVTATYPGIINAEAKLNVYPSSCNHVIVPLQSTRTISGRVVSSSGAAVPGLTVGAQLFQNNDYLERPFTTVQTNEDGAFTLVGMPDEPVKVAVFDESWNEKIAANPPVYHEGAILAPSSGVFLRMPKHVPKRRVRLKVQFSDGSPAYGAWVGLEDGVTHRLDVETDRSGSASAILNADLSYRVQAQKPIQRAPGHFLSRVVIVATRQTSNMTLILDHVRPYPYDE